MTMELPIIATRVMEKPNYKKHAAGLLERCREFYTNPENEKAFQEWKNDASQLIQRNRRIGSGGGNGGDYDRRAV